MSYNNTTVILSCQTMIEYDLVQMIAQASFVIFILLLDVCGNCMVCAAIFSYRRLRTVTNCFIVSLAVSDLLVAGLSMPFRIHHTLHSMCWDLGIGVCQFWIFVDLLCCSASICNLSMVAFVQARKLRILSCATLEQNETSDVTNHNGARQSVVSIGRMERRRRKSIIRELKATKTLAIVVGTFILCWLPFFIIMFIHQFCPDCYREVLSPDAQLGIGTVFVYVLPLLNSAVNPIIYSSFNADFRRAFRHMLFRLCVMHRRYGQTDMQTTRSMADLDMDYTFHNTNIRTENSKLPVNMYHQNGNPPKIVIHEANSDNEEEQDRIDSM
ncbi:putative G-protein coupled receptor No18 [Exaiptasia diaphana]|nr:putative G-protein coupled receptor No18 [Exaiptasia diaphana]